MELDAPNVGEIEKRFLASAIDSGFISTFGPYVTEFEDKFAKYIGVGRAVSTQSGTAALHIALHELGIGPGDEVIVPALTFIATVNPVVYVGAEPVFVDVDPDTWTIDPIEIEKNITARTKAVIPVHLYGNPCDMENIKRITDKYGIAIIEDATESLGATVNGKITGTLGDIGCFSFNGNKTITTGGGGMIAGRDTSRVEHIKFLVNQARDMTKGYFHPEIGFNYRMTNIEASLGLAQMERLEGLLEKKRLLHQRYEEGLLGCKKVSFQKEYAFSASSWWFTSVKIEKDIDITGLQAKLKEENIPTRRIFMPIVSFPPYAKSRKGGLKHSFDIYERGICLPSSTLNSLEDASLVCEKLKGILR